MSEECPATLQACQNPSSVVGTDICPIVLWAPATPILDEHGKTPCLPLASTVWQASTSAILEEDDATSHVHLTLNSIVGAYHHLVPAGVGNKT